MAETLNIKKLNIDLLKVEDLSSPKIDKIYIKLSKKRYVLNFTNFDLHILYTFLTLINYQIFEENIEYIKIDDGTYKDINSAILSISKICQ